MEQREIESGSAHEGGGYIVSRARKTEKVGGDNGRGQGDKIEACRVLYYGETCFWYEIHNLLNQIQGDQSS